MGLVALFLGFLIGYRLSSRIVAKDWKQKLYYALGIPLLIVVVAILMCGYETKNGYLVGRICFPLIIACLPYAAVMLFRMKRTETEKQTNNKIDNDFAEVTAKHENLPTLYFKNQHLRPRILFIVMAAIVAIATYFLLYFPDMRFGYARGLLKDGDTISAVPILRDLAYDGKLKAQLLLSDVYMESLKCEDDELVMLDRAAHRDSLMLENMIELYRKLAYEVDLEKFHVKCRTLANYALSKGRCLKAAHHALSFCAYYDSPRNIELSLYHANKAVSLGLYSALRVKGWLLDHYYPSRSAEAFECYNKLLRYYPNDKELICQIGEMFLHGKGVEQDSLKACEYIQKSADMGYFYAQKQLAALMKSDGK